MSDWRKWSVGDRVKAVFDDFDGCTKSICKVIEKNPDHLVVEMTHMMIGGKYYPEKGKPMTMWVDDDFAEHFSLIPEGETV